MIYDFTMSNIHTLDFFHILLCERKVENIKVLLNPIYMNRFRNDDNTALNIPAKGHLCGRFPVLLADFNQNRIFKTEAATF